MKILQTKHFKRWFQRIRDVDGRARIAARIRRFTLNNPGDVKPVGNGIYELRVHFGPGYRIYFVYQSKTTAILLYAGTKDTQVQDVKKAMALTRELTENQNESTKSRIERK